MLKQNQNGVSGVMVTLVSTIVLLVSAIVFGFWAYSGRQDYKNNVDTKVAAAVSTAKQQESTAKDQQFAEASKNPLKTYNGPQAYGSIVLQFPKTWSGYVDDTGSGSALVDGYFYPGVVPAINGSASVFALRLQVTNQSYSQTLNNLNNQATNPPTVNAYALPKVPGAVGVKVTGTLPVNNGSNNGATGTMVILPLRSQTLELWTEGSQFTNDFNNYILPNFTFSP